MSRYFSFRPGLEVRGRKFKGLRGFAGKPFHPPLTDFTIGAFSVGPVMIAIAFVFQGSSWAEPWASSAGYVIFLGAVSALVTVLTGFWDWWKSTTKGTQARRMVNAHAWTMVVMIVFVVLYLIRRFLGENTDPGDLLILVLALIILALATIGGTLGGSLVYDWGFNVEVAKDHPVWHPSPTNDYVHPADQPTQVPEA